MSDNKLKIRINLQQPGSRETDDQNALEVMEIQSIPDHWDSQKKPPFDWRKITIAAIVLTVLAGSAASFLLSHTKTGDSDETGSMQVKPGHPEDYSLRFNTFGDAPSTAPAVDRLPESMETKQPSGTKSTNNTAGTGTAALATNTKHDPVAVINQVPAPLPKPSRAIPAPVIPLPKPAPQSGNSVDSQPEIPEVSSKNEQAVIDANRLTDRPEVIRALLTHQIRHREPVDDISRIQRNDNKAIYFFVELHGLANQHVIVDWHFGDQHMSETRLHIGGDHWRTHAQKLFGKKHIGTWEVTLRDETGNTLAKRRFVVE